MWRNTIRDIAHCISTAGKINRKLPFMSSKYFRMIFAVRNFVTRILSYCEIFSIRIFRSSVVWNRSVPGMTKKIELRGHDFFSTSYRGPSYHISTHICIHLLVWSYYSKAHSPSYVSLSHEHKICPLNASFHRAQCEQLIWLCEATNKCWD